MNTYAIKMQSRTNEIHKLQAETDVEAIKLFMNYGIYQVHKDRVFEVYLIHYYQYTDMITENYEYCGKLEEIITGNFDTGSNGDNFMECQKCGENISWNEFEANHGLCDECLEFVEQIKIGGFIPDYKEICGLE